MGGQEAPACDDLNLHLDLIKTVDDRPHCVSLLLPWGVLVEGVAKELRRARPGGPPRQEDRLSLTLTDASSGLHFLSHQMNRNIL